MLTYSVLYDLFFATPPGSAFWPGQIIRQRDWSTTPGRARQVAQQRAHATGWQVHGLQIVDPTMDVGYEQPLLDLMDAVRPTLAIQYSVSEPLGQHPRYAIAWQRREPRSTTVGLPTYSAQAVTAEDQIAEIIAYLVGMVLPVVNLR